MIVLERVSALHAKHEHVLDELVMDILRVLASPDMEVRKKALAIALEMVSSRNVEEVVGFLKKELVKTLDGQFEKVSYFAPPHIFDVTLIQSPLLHRVLSTDKP